MEEVRSISSKYGIALAEGVRPVSVALSPFLANRGFGPVTAAQGGVIDYFARGGMKEKHVAQIARAGEWRVWAEPETGGEAYIPLARSKRMRSLAIWEETGRRLGVERYDYAAGGFHEMSDVPRPPRSPHGPPISTASEASWTNWYEQVAELVEAYDRTRVPLAGVDRGGIFAPRWMAFDNGGDLQPGWTMAYNGTGAPEPVGGSDSALAAAVRSLQQQVARLGITKVTKFEIGEVRAQDYADFMRQLESRQRMANLAGDSWPT